MACRRDLQDITRDCIETGATFLCLKVEKPCRVPRPVPDKTLIIIGLGRLCPLNGMFHGVDLISGESTIVSGDTLQDFYRGNRGGGLGLALRVKFKSSPP